MKHSTCQVSYSIRSIAEKALKLKVSRLSHLSCYVLPMLEFCVCGLSQQQNVPRLDRDPDQLVIQHGGRILPFQLHPQRWSIRGGVFRPQQDNGGEHILNHPLHGAAESSLRPLRRRRHMVGADACSADVRRHRFPAVQRQPPLGQCHRISRRNGLHNVFAPGKPGGGFFLLALHDGGGIDRLTAHLRRGAVPPVTPMQVTAARISTMHGWSDR